MTKPNHDSPPADGTAWGTWEELLLAYAVNRYGTNNWDSISSELQKRTSDPNIFTPNNCKHKYKQLHHRFNLSNAGDGDDTTASAVPWIEQLRQLRVAELQKQLQNFDLYISSLQLKVKKLTGDATRTPDLDLKTGEIENKPADLVISGAGVDESGRDDQSMNGSNGNLETGKPGSCDGKPDASEPVETEPDEDARVEPESRIVRENSDVQSSVSKTRKERSDRVRRGCTKVDGEDQLRNSVAVESWPLIDLLNKIHQLGSAVFERRLDRQEKLRYKNLIREHIDYKILQTRLKEGWYSDNKKFFRDLLLLVNNTSIFFPSESPEFVAAIDLRQFIVKEITSDKKQKNDSKSMVKQTSKPELAGPMIACKKRSSIATKFLNRLNEGSSTSNNEAVGVADGGGSENDGEGVKRNSGGRQLKEPNSPARRNVGRPPKKAVTPPSAAVTLGKRNRGFVEPESWVSKQRKKR